MMTRITPRPIPPTIINNSDPLAQRGPIQPMEYPDDVKGRYWLLLLVPMLVVFAIGTAVMP